MDTVESRRNLRNLNDFDQRWYVQRPSAFSWPVIHPLAEGDRIKMGSQSVRVLETPGHSRDGLALFLEEAEVLIVGDYLSPLEIPFVEDLVSYRKTLLRFLELVPRLKEVIPGHGPRLSPSQAQEIAMQDLRYLDRLEELVKNQDWEAATKLALPRAEQVPGMRDFHLENCVKAGLARP